MRSFFHEQRNPQIKEIPKTERQLLLEDLEKTKCDLDVAYRGFDYVTDPDLIDCYIYDINAALKRYKHLLEELESLNEEPVFLSHPSDAKTTVQALLG